jgi:hypothetical protein
MTDPILLTDEQMREFIVNGYLVFTPTTSARQNPLQATRRHVYWPQDRCR